MAALMDAAPVDRSSSAEQYFTAASILDNGEPANLDAAADAYRRALELDPYLVPALDSLRWIQANRRIFFLGARLSSFLEGQTSAEALLAVERFLEDHASLPRDLREKLLQAQDELTRTVRIRGATPYRVP